MSLTEEVKEYIITEFAPDARPDELDSDYDLLDSGLVDSLNLVRLINWTGKQYDVDVDEIDLNPDHFRSIEAICAFVTKFRPPS